MSLEARAVVTILCMAAVTYATRASGLWLIGRVQLSPRVEAGLRYVPGAVLISFVAPALLDAGARGVVAGLVTAIVAWRSKSPLIAMICGVATLVALRAIPVP
jgi:uncharacterized membrane protein